MRNTSVFNHTVQKRKNTSLNKDATQHTPYQNTHNTNTHTFKHTIQKNTINTHPNTKQQCITKTHNTNNHTIL